jgi:hypothetical protein
MPTQNDQLSILYEEIYKPNAWERGFKNNTHDLKPDALEYTKDTSVDLKPDTSDTRSETNWNVIKSGSVYQLRFNDIPIMDYALAQRGDIKEIKTYGYNFITKLPKDIKIPPIMFLYGRAENLERE